MYRYWHINLSELVPKWLLATDLGTNPLKFQIDAKVDRTPRGRIWPKWSKVWSQYTYSLRMDELGPRVGGEGPRAEGGRGKVNLPPISGLTRPTKGSADFGISWDDFGMMVG